MGKLAIDDELLDKVAAAAKERGVSSERFAQDVLRDALHLEHTKPNLRKLMEEIASMTPTDVVQTDSVDLLREDRDR